MPVLLRYMLAILTLRVTRSIEALEAMSDCNKVAVAGRQRLIDAAAKSTVCEKTI